MADPRLTGKLASFDPSPYVSGSVPVSRVVDIKIVFDYFDHDGNGHIDPKQFKTCIQQLGFGKSTNPNQEAYNLLAHFDQDNSGVLEFKEFVTLLTAETQLPLLKALQQNVAGASKNITENS